MRKNNILKRNANLKKLNEKVREQKAITLIALVITIIVLLILASVSIAMLTGENGILTKATTANENTQRAEVIERAQIDIVAVQAENDGKVTETKLKEVLNKYFDNVPETLPDDLSTSTLTLTTKSEYGNYSIKASDIYNGTVSRITWAWTDTDGDGTKNIGDFVNCSTGESFRIISTEGDNYALLAEKNIDTSSLKQRDSARTVAFCSINAYSSLGSFAYRENLNDNATIKADTTSAVYYARKYAECITGNAEDGRLMLYDEASTLKGSYSSMIYGKETTAGYLNYWLGSAYNEDDTYNVMTVFGKFDYVDGFNIYRTDDKYGVRPVLKISKSLIS